MLHLCTQLVHGNDKVLQLIARGVFIRSIFVIVSFVLLRFRPFLCVASYSAIASFENSVFFSLVYIFLVTVHFLVSGKDGRAFGIVLVDNFKILVIKNKKKMNEF